MAKELGKADMLACLNDNQRYWYKRQCAWNNKMARLLAKEPKSWKDFSFMPKGEVS